MSFRRVPRLRLIAAWCTGALLLCATAAQADPSVTTYPLPTGLKSGSGIVTDVDGKVWFGADDVFTPTAATPRLVRFDVTQAGGADLGTTTYPTPTFLNAPCCATRITSLAYDRTSGRVWLVRNDGLYGFASPGDLVPGSSSAGFTVDHLPSFSSLDSVAIDPPTGGAWTVETTTTNVASPLGSGYFPGARAARIGLTPGPQPGLSLIESANLAQQQGQTTLDSLRYDAKPSGIVSDGQGGAWFGEADSGNPGWRIAHAVGSGYTEFQLPCVSNSPCSGSFAGTGGPNSLAMAPDGAVWFTVPLSKSIGRFDGGSFTIFPLSGISPTLATGNPLQLRSAPDGTLWLAVAGAPGAASNAIVRIVPTAAPTATVYPVTAGRPTSVTASAEGDVWFTLSANAGTGLIGRIAGAVTVTAPPAVAGTPAPSAPANVVPAPAPGAVVFKGSTSVAQPARVTSSGDTATVDQQCVGPPSDPCSLVFIISAQEYVRGFPGSRPRGARSALAVPKAPVVLGELSVTLKGGEKRKIKVRLGKKARKALAVQGSIKTKLTVTQTQPDGTSKVISSKKLTFKRKP